MFGASQGLSVIGGYSGAESTPATQGNQEAGRGQPKGDDQNLMPVTIQMVNSAISKRSDHGNELRFHGKEAGSVLVVGIVEDFTRQQAAIEFTLNDGMGTIRARHFFRSSADQLERVKQGVYVSAVGTMKTEPHVHFSVLAVRPVDSPDEISYHMIETAHTALKMRRSAPSQSDKMELSPATAAPPRLQAADTPSPKKIVLEEAAFSPPKSVAPVKLQGLQLQEEIRRYLAKAAGIEGVARQDLHNQLQASASSGEVDSALGSLVDEGQAYTTIDEEHFAAV